jgi:hypothetical protein
MKKLIAVFVLFFVFSCSQEQNEIKSAAKKDEPKKSVAAPSASRSGSGQEHQSASAFPGLGSFTAARESSIEIKLSRDEVRKLVPCPQPIPECLQRQKLASRTSVVPDAGNAFVQIVFRDAPLRKKIEYGEGDYGLIVEGVGELKAHAVMIQVNKFGMVNEEFERVPDLENTVLERDVFGTSYFPMDGDKPFTLVFQVPAGASSGSMRIKDQQIAVNW